MGDDPSRKDGNGAAAPGSGEVGSAPQAGSRPVQPLFYTNPLPVTADRHGGKALRQPVDYRFAASAHAVVLHAQEFRLAAAHYPIVFADDESATPLAVLGYKDARNVFVDAAGRWRAGAYVPAYVRRYPFATGQGGKPDELVLYVDEASDLVADVASTPGARPLFQDGQPSDVIKEALDLCVAFQRQVPATSAFVDEVKKRELLQAKELTLDLPGGGRQQLTGMRIIEEARFAPLADEVFLEWRRRGWLALVYWHWASLDNFARLVERDRAGAGSAP